MKLQVSKAGVELLVITNERRWVTVQFHRRWCAPRIRRHTFPNTTFNCEGGRETAISLGFLTLTHAKFTVLTPEQAAWLREVASKAF